MGVNCWTWGWHPYFPNACATCITSKRNETVVMKRGIRMSKVKRQLPTEEELNEARNKYSTPARLVEAASLHTLKNWNDEVDGDQMAVCSPAKKGDCSQEWMAGLSAWSRQVSCQWYDGLSKGKELCRPPSSTEDLYGLYELLGDGFTYSEGAMAVAYKHVSSAAESRVNVQQEYNDMNEALAKYNCINSAR